MNNYISYLRNLERAKVSRESFKIFFEGPNQLEPNWLAVLSSWISFNWSLTNMAPVVHKCITVSERYTVNDRKKWENNGGPLKTLVLIWRTVVDKKWATGRMRKYTGKVCEEKMATAALIGVTQNVQAVDAMPMSCQPWCLIPT